MSKPHKYTNKELIEILKEVLAAMEVKEVNRFRIRAYQNVITAIEGLSQSVQDLWKANRLDEIPGVGGTLKQHFDDLFTTGEVKDFIEVKEDLPEGMFSLIGIRGIGAKKAFKLASAFNLENREDALEELKKAAEKEEIQKLPGFAPKSEQAILDAISEAKMHKKEKERLLLPTAEDIAKRVTDYLKELECIEDAIALGSLRRRSSTVGDLDIAVSTTCPEEAISHFLEFSEIEDVLAHGDKGARAVLTTDVQIDLRVIEPHALGSMVQYFTGSKLHNVVLRTYALDKKMSLSEYGIKYQDKLHEFSTDKEFYEFLGLSYIVPELRQGKNEIELAKSNLLPDLIVLDDIQGDLHTHTDFSDGKNTFEEMSTRALEKGYSYYGITDHAPSVTSRGSSEVSNIISDQKMKFESFNATNDSLRLLYGYEVNILNDATLGMPDDLMAELDYVVASIHTSFDQPKEQITDRLISAIENPYVKIIGHPTNRIINGRPACTPDWEKVFKACVENNTFLEINSQPDRLDLPEDLVYEGLKVGVKFIVNTDAHAVDQLEHMKYGINVARRGWCTKNDIVNALPTHDFLSLLGVK